MRVAASTLLLGAASVAIAQHEQIVLGGVQDAFQPIVDSTTGSAQSALEKIEETLGKIPTEAKGLWMEMQLLVPGFMEKAQHMISRPKAHKRKPDSEWDHVVKGADIQSMWTKTDGEEHRVIDGSLEAYNLRAKNVDPSALGVDKVKQYSGYLDDEANDKHLFYCKSSFESLLLLPSYSRSVLSRVL
jgi:cathepsin A (carboxypeptidase C)